MKKFESIDILALLIISCAAIASSCGIFYSEGKGSYEFVSIHGKEIIIYGKGLYQHMSADVAIQGIAQDYITLFVAIPALLVFTILNHRTNLRNQLVFAGILGYFMVTYIFYMCMGMYNQLFLLYVILAGTSFFGFLKSLENIDKSKLTRAFINNKSQFPAWVLIIIPIMIGILWLNIVVPPLLDGSIYPPSLDHYTTLIVQGFDLAILLPASFSIGIFLFKKNIKGYLFGPIYLVFLSFLMLALIAKIIAMGNNGVPVGPPIVIIPLTWAITCWAAFIMLKKTKASITTEALSESL